MSGELLEKLLNPRAPERRLQEVETQVRRLIMAGGLLSTSGAGPGASPNGPQTPDITTVAQSDSWDQEGKYTPTFTISVDTGSVPPPPDTICYVARITPSYGTAFVRTGPQYSDTNTVLLPIVFQAAMPIGTATVEVALRSAAGDGPYCDPFQFAVGGDPNTPPTPTSLTQIDSGRLNAVRLTWDAPSFPGYRSTQVWGTYTPVGSFTAVTTVLKEVTTNSVELNYDLSTMQDGMKVQVSHANKSGTVGPLCSIVTVTRRKIFSSDFAAGAVDAAALATITDALKVQINVEANPLRFYSNSLGYVGQIAFDSTSSKLQLIAAGPSLTNPILDLHGGSTHITIATAGVAITDATTISNISNAGTTLSLNGDIGAVYNLLDVFTYGGTRLAKMDPVGNLTVPSALTPRVKSISGELLLQMTGDSLGGISMYLHNRGGENGLILEGDFTDPTITLIDLILRHAGGQRNIRLEGRAPYVFTGTSQEFQWGVPGDPHTAASTGGFIQRYGRVNSLNGFAFNGTNGFTGTVALAKLTTSGANGSLTVSGGIITAYTAPT